MNQELIRPGTWVNISSIYGSQNCVILVVGSEYSLVFLSGTDEINKALRVHNSRLKEGIYLGSGTPRKLRWWSSDKNPWNKPTGAPWV